MAKRGPYKKSDDRRQLVINSAIDVFSARGFNGGSIRDIAREADIPHTSVLRLFSSKEELLKAVLAESESRTLRVFNLETSPPMQMLVNLVHLARRNAQRKGLIELYALLSAESVLPDHPASSYFQNRYSDIRVRLTEVFSELNSLGYLKEGANPLSFAIDTVAHSDGTQIQWLHNPLIVDLVEQTRLFLESLLNAEGKALFTELLGDYK